MDRRDRGNASGFVLGSCTNAGLRRGWPETPEFVFCSEVGGALDERNVSRVWDRLRRRAQKQGVRPLKLHCAWHTWATLALRAGKFVRWVADQFGRADPPLTLRVYAHAMREEESDLWFADFAVQGAAKSDHRIRLRTALSGSGLSGRH